MGRAVVVGALILLIVALPIAAFWALLDCPECDASPCLRCGSRGRLTVYQRATGTPSHPSVLALLRKPRNPDPLHRLGGPDLLAWDGMKDAFEPVYAVPLRDGTLLIGLEYDGVEENRGTPLRLLLFAREGPLLDRLDAWLQAPTRQVLDMDAEDEGIRLLIYEATAWEGPRSPNLVIRRGTEAEARRPLPASGTVPLGRVVSREGRLELEER